MSYERGATSVGERGEGCLAPPLPYFDSFLKCLNDPCHHTANPKGYIALCVAENKLVQELLSIRLAEAARVAFEYEDVYAYNDFLGLPDVRSTIAEFLTRYFLLGEGASSISSDHVALGSGCSSLLSHLFYTLAEAGDAILIPSPYYAAFETDMKTISNCIPFACPMNDQSLGPTKIDLQAAYDRATKRGFNVKMLILTNPNNPTGVIYKKNVIVECIDWAREHNLHTVVDEIYAFSVFPKNETSNSNEFTSVLRLLYDDMGDDVHMLWALSKDFGSSGFRIGVLCSRNAVLLKAVGNLNVFSGVSHPMQRIAADMLSDEVFVNDFFRKSSARLYASYCICTENLDRLLIPYTKASAGMFVYCDFSSFLPDPKSFASERGFARVVEEIAHVVMTPGESQRDTEPGRFRICYAWVSPDVLKIAMARLEKLIIYISTQKNGLESLLSQIAQDNLTSDTVALRDEILSNVGNNS